MDDVVVNIEKEAPPGATLWVTGLMVATYIQFASDLPPANTFFVPFQLDPPLVNALPLPGHQIMGQYLNNPPTVLAVYGFSLETIAIPTRPPDPHEISDSNQLVGALLAGGEYRKRGSINGFEIFVCATSE